MVAVRERPPIGSVARRAISGQSTGLLPAIAAAAEHPHIRAARKVLSENPTPSIARAASSHVAAVASGKGTPGVKKLPQSVYNAINRAVTPEFGRWAKANYGVGGKRLLALVAAGEGGGSIDEGTSNTSSAGARGPFQFISSTRNAYRQQYHIDAWKNDYSAARAAMIHLKGTGVAGYNPGMPSYTHYILSQSVDSRPLVTGNYGSRAGGGKVAGGAGMPGSVRVDHGSVAPEQGMSALMAALQAQTQPAPVGGAPLTPPSFAASPALPVGYQAVPSGGGPAPPKPDISELMSLVQPGSGLPDSNVVTTPATPGDGGGKVTVHGPGGKVMHYGPSGGVPGQLQGSPIDRAGVPTHHSALEGALAVSAVLGVPIQVGTGTAHNQYTSAGNISAHWGGDALDLPMLGKRLMAAGRSALIAAGMSHKDAMKANGGIYNVNGWEIIFNAADHYDHLHIQVPRGYKAPAWAHGRR